MRTTMAVVVFLLAVAMLVPLSEPASAQSNCAVVAAGGGCTSPAAACTGTPVGADISCQCFNNVNNQCRCWSMPSRTVECTGQAPVAGVPTLSQWGVVTLVVVLLTAGIIFNRRRHLPVGG